jgi:hypothetical protein
MGRDNAVMEDVLDVGFGGEATESGCIVFQGCGFDGGDAEVLVAVGETGSGGGDEGLCVGGDGGVAIEDKIAMGSDAGGVDLGSSHAGEEERQDTEPLQKTMNGLTCRVKMKIGRVKSQAGGNRHGCTSMLR